MPALGRMRTKAHTIRLRQANVARAARRGRRTLLHSCAIALLQSRTRNAAFSAYSLAFSVAFSISHERKLAHTHLAQAGFCLKKIAILSRCARIKTLARSITRRSRRRKQTRETGRSILRIFQGKPPAQRKKRYTKRLYSDLVTRFQLWTLH